MDHVFIICNHFHAIESMSWFSTEQKNNHAFIQYAQIQSMRFYINRAREKKNTNRTKFLMCFIIISACDRQFFCVHKESEWLTIAIKRCCVHKSVFNSVFNWIRTLAVKRTWKLQKLPRNENKHKIYETKKKLLRTKSLLWNIEWIAHIYSKIKIARIYGQLHRCMCVMMSMSGKRDTEWVCVNVWMWCTVVITQTSFILFISVELSWMLFH